MAFPSRIGCSGGDVRILAGGRRACSKCANYKHGNRPRAAGCGHALRSAVSAATPGRSDGSSASAHLNSTDNNSGRSDTAGCYHHHRTSKGAEKEEV